MGQRRPVDRRVDAAAGEQRLQRGGEADAVAALVDVERLDAEPVAGEDQPPGAVLDHRDREHAEEVVDEVGAPLGVGLEHDLGVRRREEAVPGRLELGAQLLVVVDDPVEHHGEPEVRIDHRLRAVDRQVDDRQPPVPQGHRAARPHAGAVRAAMLQAGRSCAAAWRRRRRVPSKRSSPASPHISGPSSVGSVTIQVSLAPPPRELLTIRLPGGATRVRASGASRQSSRRGPGEVDERPQVDAAGLQPPGRPGRAARTARRPPGRPSRPGSAAISARRARDLGRRGRRADQHAGAAVAVDRLGHQLADPLEDAAPLDLVGRCGRWAPTRGRGARRGSR